MDAAKRHVTVCVCTFKRPALLRRLLEELERQETEGLFSYSVVVVDNDASRSAERTVEEFRKKPGFDLKYVVEPEQNIALARNASVENARGDFIAIIDDDEYPPRDWLLRMFNACDKYGVDGMLGPVLPRYEGEPPKWIIRGGFLEKPSYKTGTVLDWTSTRTSNVFLRRDVFDGKDCMFRPQFGEGGEDKDFFRRMIGKGRRFVWCQEAPVTEAVPRGRCTRSFLLRQALQRGYKPPYTRGYALYFKPLVAAPLYTLLLPFLIFAPHHIFMKYLIKDCHHIGRILNFLGLKLIKDGYVQG